MISTRAKRSNRGTCLFCFIIATLSVLTPRETGASPFSQFASTKTTVSIYWDEEIPSLCNNNKNKIRAKDANIAGKRQSGNTLTKLPANHRHPEPHKLRTDKWALNVHWRNRPRNHEARQERMELEFSDNGYVRLLSSTNDDDDTTTTVIMGHWELASHGLTWNLVRPVSGENTIGNNSTVSTTTTTTTSRMTFHGDLLLNPFGPQPRIVRGVVLGQSASSRGWFRPVLATFTGNGIGKDTADVSHRNRK